MSIESSLIEIERGFWEKGEPHYRAYMDDQVLVAFQTMAGVKSNEEIATLSKDAPKWNDVDIELTGFVQPGDDFAAINYRIAASRDDGSRHHAIVTTAYVRRGDDWRAAVHSQIMLQEGDTD